MLPTSLMRRLALVALPLALSAGMAPAAAEPGVTADSLKIGILGSLTGPFAIFGSGNLAGATLAFEQANAAGGIHGRKLEWLSLDDESSPPKGIAAYKRLVGPEQVFAVFGPSASAVGQAMVQTFKTSTTPTFISVFSTPIVTDPPLPNVFRTGPMNDREQGVAIANYALDHLKAKRVALIRQSDEYGKSGGESVLQRLKARGAEPVALEVFNVYDTDFNAQLTKIAAARPDVLVVYGYPNPSAIITRQARQLGVEGVVLGSNSAGSRKYPEIVGKAAAGTQNIMTLEILPESSRTWRARGVRTWATRSATAARWRSWKASSAPARSPRSRAWSRRWSRCRASRPASRCPPPSVPACARATAPRASWRSATICRAASCPSWSASMA